MYRAEIGLHTYCKYLKISELVKLSQTLRTGADFKVFTIGV